MQNLTSASRVPQPPEFLRLVLGAESASGGQHSTVWSVFMLWGRTWLPVILPWAVYSPLLTQLVVVTWLLQSSEPFPMQGTLSPEQPCGHCCANAFCSISMRVAALLEQCGRASLSWQGTLSRSQPYFAKVVSGAMLLTQGCWLSMALRTLEGCKNTTV